MEWLSPGHHGASVLERGLSYQAHRCPQPPLLKGWERVGARPIASVCLPCPASPTPRKRPGPMHGGAGLSSRNHREGLPVGNYQLKLENLTTITTWRGPGYSSEQVTGNGRRLHTEHTAPQGEPTGQEQGLSLPRDMGRGAVAMLPGSWHGDGGSIPAPGLGQTLRLAMEGSWIPDARVDR